MDQLSPERPAMAVSKPLHGAAKYGLSALFHKPQLRPLLMDEDKTGNTALHLHSNSVDASSVHELVRLGADVNRRNADGDTALDEAVSRLERQVWDAKRDSTRPSVHREVSPRLGGAPTGNLLRRGQTGRAIDLSVVPVRVRCKLKDSRAGVQCLITAGVHAGFLGGGSGARGYGSARGLSLRVFPGADGLKVKRGSPTGGLAAEPTAPVLYHPGASDVQCRRGEHQPPPPRRRRHRAVLTSGRREGCGA